MDGENLLFYISFIDITKAIDLVSRHDFFKILTKIGFAPKLRGLVKSFHNNMWYAVQHNGYVSKPFKILNGGKQACVLADRSNKKVTCKPF